MVDTLAAGIAAEPDEAKRPALSSAAEFWRRPRTRITLAILLILVVLPILAPWIAPYPPNEPSSAVLQTPSASHLFGTDELGRDVLSRVLYGARASLMIGVGSVVLAALIGVPLGLIAGYFARVDTLISRTVEVMLAFPSLILAIGLAAILGPSPWTAMVAITTAEIPLFVRVIRGEALRIKSADYIASAIVCGARSLTVLCRHILPNAAPVLLVQITVAIPAAVLSEAMLSFLGLGIRPPAPSLGVMLSKAQQFFEIAWWVAVIPGCAIVAIAFTFNRVGDMLRQVVDPKASTS